MREGFQEKDLVWLKINKTGAVKMLSQAFWLWAEIIIIKKKEQKGKQTINNWISIQTYKKQKHGQILNITYGHTHGHIHNKNTHI